MVYVHTLTWIPVEIIGGFNPFEKKLVKMGIFPSRGENKNIWNHHLDPHLCLPYNETRGFAHRNLRKQDGMFFCIDLALGIKFTTEEMHLTYSP